MSAWISRIGRSKTMIFALILAVTGAIQASTDFLSTVMSPHAFGYLTLVSGLITAVLRVLTTQPLEDK